MKTPEIPADEEQRLREVRALNMLDTPAEERFDRLTRLAKRLFDVQISYVGLLEDDRQWFKSVDGMAFTGTARAVSFCGHAILQNEALVIEDAHEDPRFHDNPLVTANPHIRFYAGCPLRTPNGAKVGTFCIIDDKPRTFSAEDRISLHDLASMAEAELLAFQTATSDELTKITNRRGFKTLSEMLLTESVVQRQYACLAFLDLNKFKQINDTFGHQEGDRALVDFAEALKLSFRRSDLFARLGGDEFVVLLSDTRQSDAERRVTAFRQQLEEVIARLDRPYQLSFSSGIVEFDPAAPLTLDQLLTHSDAIMYQNKKRHHATG